MTLKTLGLCLAALGLSACSDGAIGIGNGFGLIEGDAQTPDKTIDRGRDQKDLSQLVAGVWIDPNGCDHWIIDDGIEGYLSTRLDRFGKPVCSGHGAETIASGPFKEGSTVGDLSN